MEAERVVWIDSGEMIEDGWKDLDFYKRYANKWRGEVETIGSPIYEDDRVLILGLSHDRQNDTWFAAQLIHKSSIIYRAALQ